MTPLLRLRVALLLTLSLPAWRPLCAQSVPAAAIAAGQRALQSRQFLQAKSLFAGYLREHPESVEAELGLADSELGLRAYEAAEIEYRKVVAAQPELWLAHRNLVIVEAELGRWEEFDRERALLRAARARGAPGISARESDVIDAFDITPRGGEREHWIVRAYEQPVGRTLTRYNFERFDAAGRVQAYLSLEDAEAAAVLPHGELHLGEEPAASPSHGFALNFYTGHAHGTIARYATEPSYERVRQDVMRWLRR